LYLSTYLIAARSDTKRRSAHGYQSPFVLSELKGVEYLCVIDCFENARICRAAGVNWRPGRVYFLTLLESSRDDRIRALSARLASHLPL